MASGSPEIPFLVDVSGTDLQHIRGSVCLTIFDRTLGNDQMAAGEEPNWRQSCRQAEDHEVSLLVVFGLKSFACFSACTF